MTRMKHALAEALVAELDHVYHVALRLTRDPAVAEDMVQETYARALDAQNSLKDAAKARVWLFSILKNCFFNYAKRERRLRLVNVEESEHLASTVDFPAEQRLLSIESAGVLEEALAALPPDFRMAVLLCDVEELSYAEIAEAMDCPVGTVRSRVARGRSLLAADLRKRSSLIAEKEVKS
jgi:RNA polymerase sigma-70 factor (ECF subfamily)